jgi:hypothetical protein
VWIWQCLVHQHTLRKAKASPQDKGTGTHGMVSEDDTWHANIAYNPMDPTWQLKESGLSSVGACHSNEYLLKGGGTWVQDRRNSRFKQSNWSRAKFGPKEITLGYKI